MSDLRKSLEAEPMTLAGASVEDVRAMAAMQSDEPLGRQMFIAGFATARKMGTRELAVLYQLLFEWVDAFWDPLPDATHLIEKTEQAIFDDEAATEAWRKRKGI